MSNIQEWYNSTYKGIWTDDVLNDARIMKEWAQHLEDSAPSLTHEEILLKIQEREAAISAYRDGYGGEVPKRYRNEH